MVDMPSTWKRESHHVERRMLLYLTYLHAFTPCEDLGRGSSSVEVDMRSKGGMVTR